MVEATARGVGRTRGANPEDRVIDIEVVDVYDRIASVTVRSPIYHEYLHLVRTSEGWRIANALWQRTLPLRRSVTRSGPGTSRATGPPERLR